MALVRNIYGRSITFRFIPLAGDEAFVADSIVSARLYGPNTIPTDEQIEDTGQVTTGHIGDRVTTWAVVNYEGSGAAEHEIVFPALTDPQPTSSNEYDLYYIALNYRAEASGPELCVFEQVQVFRPDGLTSKVRVSAEMVYKLESKLEELAPSRLWTEGKIDLAIDEIMERLEGRGYERRKFFNLEKLNLAVTRLACSLACFNWITPGTEWEGKAAYWREQSDKSLAIAQVGYDLSGSDTPGPNEKVSTGPVFIGK